MNAARFVIKINLIKQTNVIYWGQECVELYLHFPDTPPWCGSRFKKNGRENLPLPFRLWWFL